MWETVPGVRDQREHGKVENLGSKPDGSGLVSAPPQELGDPKQVPLLASLNCCEWGKVK